MKEHTQTQYEYNNIGYYDRGNFVVNLGSYFSPHLLVSTQMQEEGRGLRLGISLY